MASNFLQNKHLLLRAGYGVELRNIQKIKTATSKEIWKELLAKSEKFSPLEIENMQDFSDYKPKEATAEMKKHFQQKNKEENAEIIIKWYQNMISSEAQLREKMTFFWTGIFATRTVVSRFNLQLLNIIKENALGNFGDLLLAVSQSPSMLQFLNNQQNKKDHPNENFARELMELFTMGRGNYTETDIKEAARAFTGWSFLPNGTFFERPRLHDYGEKTFLGKTGNFDGNDILKIILEQKATARYISKRMYQFFVNEKTDENIVNQLAEKFYQSNYDIKTILNEIFTSSWFFDEKNIGNKIKSPVELMVGIQRILPISVENPKSLIIFQKLLGQMLLFPPNVAGWPHGKAWIDSSTLMLRLKIPQIWSGIISLDYAPKDDDDMNMGMQKMLPKNLQGNFKIDWESVSKILKNENLEDVLLQSKKSIPENVINEFELEDEFKSRIIALMSTPEYQLC